MDDSENQSDLVMDNSITIESIVKEDALYNSFTYTQLRAMYSISLYLSLLDFMNFIVVPLKRRRMKLGMIRKYF